MQETCVTVTWMKYCGRLLQLTGESIFADCIEQSFYNAYLGTLNTEHRDCPYIREKFVERLKVSNLKYTFLPVDSYSPLTSGKRGQKVGGTQMLADGSYYGCCTAIAAAGVGEFLKQAVMLSESGIVINFFENGVVTFSYADSNVTLITETSYPVDGKVQITLRTDAPMFCSLMIRVPEWSCKTEIITDKGYVMKDGYAVIEGEWSGDDKITLDFDMRIRVTEPIKWDTDVIYTDMSNLKPGSHVATAMKVYHDEKDDHYVAFTRGPLTLAADSRMGKAVDSCFTFRTRNGVPVCKISEDLKIASNATCLVHGIFTDELY